jgi:hypothetical protein
VHLLALPERQKSAIMPSPGEVLDRAALLLHRACHQFVDGLNQGLSAFFAEAFGNRCKADHVREKHGCRRSPEGEVGSNGIDGVSFIRSAPYLLNCRRSGTTKRCCQCLAFARATQCSPCLKWVIRVVSDISATCPVGPRAIPAVNRRGVPTPIGELSY